MPNFAADIIAQARQDLDLAASNPAALSTPALAPIIRSLLPQIQRAHQAGLTYSVIAARLHKRLEPIHAYSIQSIHRAIANVVYRDGKPHNASSRAKPRKNTGAVEGYSDAPRQTPQIQPQAPLKAATPSPRSALLEPEAFRQGAQATPIEDLV